MSEISIDETSLNKESSTVNKEVHKMWDEKLKNLNLYHGTSLSIAENILEKGLKGDSKPYDSDDKFFVEEQAFLWGIRDGVANYSTGKGSVFFVTCSEKTASNYALCGPEMFRLHLLPLSKDVLVKMNQGGGKEDYSDDYGRMVKIKDEWLDKVVSHRPALVKIVKGSESFNKILEKSLNEEEIALLGDYEKFYEKVCSLSEESGVSVEIAAKTVTDSIRGKLLNKAVGVEVDSADLEVVEGKDFDSLNEENLKYALIRKICFGDRLEKQPYELLNFIYNVIYYKSGKIEELRGLCRYYEMDGESEGILKSMAHLSLLLKSRGLIT